MNYTELNTQLTGRNSQRRKLANNTYAERRENGIAIRLHATDIITFRDDGTIVCNSGGWKTVTTKGRLNAYLPNGFGITQRRGVWFWDSGQPFTDGDTITQTGELKAQAKDDSKEQKLRARIRKYAALYANAIPLAKPSGGDCWYCHMVTQEGKSLGDATENTDHLESHIKENYVVPSLAYHAMKEAGCGSLWFNSVFEGKIMVESAKHQLPRWIRHYLYRRFGLAA